MTAFPMAKSAGFTLIEMMLALAVLGTLVAVGMPSFTTMLRNAETRGAAESIANGLQRARAEAVARNKSVQFVLGSGNSWYVDYVATPDAANRIDANVSNEGGAKTTRSVLPAGATSISFSNLGLVIPNAANLAQITITSTGGDLTLLVKIGAGGNSRVCDPSPSLPATNFRSCSYG